MVRKFPEKAGNCPISEKRTAQPKIPEFPEENQMKRKFSWPPLVVEGGREERPWERG